MSDELVDPIDKLPADEVHLWAKEKYLYLRRYIDISRGARARFLGDGNAGATLVDLFCGVGRARIVETGEWIEGSAVAAWNASVEGKAPFSQVFIADKDNKRRAICAERLKKAGAPVIELEGDAAVAAAVYSNTVDPYGLHFAFIDPYSLGTLDFEILRNLANLRRIDMMIHVSAMDLQRNLDANIEKEDDAFDRFAPGWRENVNVKQSREATRAAVVDYWRGLVATLDMQASTQMQLITGSKNQRLYWLLLCAKNDLAHRFWDVAINATKQGKLL